MAGRIRAGNVELQMKLVADLQRKGEGAKVVPGAGGKTTARVDIKTEVETGGAKEVQAKGTPTAERAAVFQGGGSLDKKGLEQVPTETTLAQRSQQGGVLGFRMGQLVADKTTAGAASGFDPTKATAEDLRAFVGQRMTITTWDKDEASSLAEAAKKGMVIDTVGVLVDVTPEGLVLKDDPKSKETRELLSEYWDLARVKVHGDDGTKVALLHPDYDRVYVE